MLEILFDNIKYLIGENDKDNWNIIDLAKHENQNYIWFHLNSYPSPHVIMCDTESNIKKNKIDYNYSWKEYIKTGAQLCIDHTSNKYKNIPKLKVIYTEIKNIKKGVKIGEVITTKFNLI